MVPAKKKLNFYLFQVLSVRPLKPYPHGQSPVHCPYGWWSDKDVYTWVKSWIDFPPVTELEDDEYEEVPGDDDPTEYLSDDEDVSDAEDGITYQDKNQWEVEYWLYGVGMSLYYSMIIPGQDICCPWISIHMHMQR